MIGSHRQKIYDEQVLNNPYEVIEIKNNEKITLRKQKLNEKIIKMRKQNLVKSEFDLNINIKPEMKFKIKKFEDSYEQVIRYLKSNNKDLIKYSLNELNFFFMFNDLNAKEQIMIIEKPFFKILLKLGNTFIEDKNINDLYKILYILINIQVCEVGTKEYCKELYSKDFLEFYNKCMIVWDNDKEIFNLIRWIIYSLTIINDYLNLELLRSDVFLSILDFYENQNIKENEDKKLTLKLINYCLDISNLESLLNDDDITIIDKCLGQLEKDLFSTNSAELLYLIYRGIYLISNLDTDYNFNKRIIDGGVTLRILKTKFNELKINKFIMKIIDFSLRIIANNLTASDKDCEIIYDLNIIDFYNNLLERFDDYKIIRNILIGLANIAVGSNRNVILNSKIWEEKYIQKYCNILDEFKISYIKIVKYMVYHADFTILKFIFNTKILHYFLFLIATNNKSKIVYRKILKLIDSYLKKFNKENKETEEYLLIFHKLKDIIQSSDIINDMDNINIITIITENIKNNYN